MKTFKEWYHELDINVQAELKRLFWNYYTIDFDEPDCMTKHYVVKVQVK